MSMASSSWNRSSSSTPYAPMFCMGPAPVLPGIRDRFSSPFHPRSSDSMTKSCQTTPAPTRTHTESLSRRTSSMPSMPNRSTSPGTSCVSSTLLPPPNMWSGHPEAWCHSSASRTASTDPQETKCSAVDGKPNVVSSARGRLDSSCTSRSNGADTVAGLLHGMGSNRSMFLTASSYSSCSIETSSPSFTRSRRDATYSRSA